MVAAGGVLLLVVEALVYVDCHNPADYEVDCRCYCA